MTDRLNALTVVLDKDIRVDDAEALIAAISQFRGVLSVQGNVSDINSHIATERAMYAVREKVFEALAPKKN